MYFSRGQIKSARVHIVIARWYLGQQLPPTPRCAAGCTTEHHRKFLLPAVIRLHNSSSKSVRHSKSTDQSWTHLTPVSTSNYQLCIIIFIMNFTCSITLLVNILAFLLFLLCFLSIINSSIEQLLCKCTLLNTCGTFGNNLQESSLQPLLFILQIRNYLLDSCSFMLISLNLVQTVPITALMTFKNLLLAQHPNNKQCALYTYTVIYCIVNTKLKQACLMKLVCIHMVLENRKVLCQVR